LDIIDFVLLLLLLLLLLKYHTCKTLLIHLLRACLSCCRK